MQNRILRFFGTQLFNCSFSILLERDYSIKGFLGFGWVYALLCGCKNELLTVNCISDISVVGIIVLLL